MMLVVKIFAFVGVLSNFFGSMMLLRDFRDILALPFHRWRANSLRKQIETFVEKNGGYPTPSIRDPLRRTWPVRDFRIIEMIRADPMLREFMRLNNEHNSFRKAIGLTSLSIVDPFTFNAEALRRSFREIQEFLDNWAAEPDPESSTDRTRALKFFIGGFLLLTIAAFLDLILYVFQ
ncbi:hypothetical protein O9X90_00810 [Agrobacterium leguminum]|uniref:hypothetical protein n=1 Tax=Agrobacterium leguminum TaxID=2792015 RepID=UPI0022B84960|nr:hypothetical protein [Agrobacterium leguminum]MCZ7930841.1 hypothetical protein [Agrobacterium leguminum]